MSLHGPAGACIPVASASPIQRVLKHCGAHKHSFFFTPQLAGKARQLGCPKIVLDHVRVYIYRAVKL